MHKELLSLDWMIVRISESDASSKHSFLKIFIGLHVCLVVATTLKIRKPMPFLTMPYGENDSDFWVEI